MNNDTNLNLTLNEIILPKKNMLIYCIYIIVGYSITLVSFTFKLPQIYSILKNKSTKSISTLSNYFDFYSILFQGLYSLHKNLSIVIYLEYFSTTLQNTTIIFLSWIYSEKESSNLKYFLRIFFLISTPYIIFIAIINNGNYISNSIWNIMVLCGLPFMTISRLSQMKSIYINKSAGSVSLMSFVMRAVKNFFKVWIILYETINWQLIINQGYYGILALGVIYMILKYNKSPILPYDKKMSKTVN